MEGKARIGKGRVHFSLTKVYQRIGIYDHSTELYARYDMRLVVVCDHGLDTLRRGRRARKCEHQQQ